MIGQSCTVTCAYCAWSQSLDPACDGPLNAFDAFVATIGLLREAVIEHVRTAHPAIFATADGLIPPEVL